MICKINVDPAVGEPVDATRCPVAQAICGVAASDVRVSVTHKRVRMWKDFFPFEERLIEFKDEVVDRIRDIDCGRPVQPFSFSLDIPLGFHK